MKKMLALFIALLMLFQLAACAGNQNDETTKPAGTEKATTTKVSEDQIIKGGKLVLGTLGECSSYASWRIRGEYYILGGVYEPLLMYDQDGKLQPYLAESFIADPANLTYTIKLRDGIKFSDGSILDGEALLWNFENFKENSQNAKTYFTDVDHFELVDDMTVAIHMSSWASQIPDALNNVAGFMYSKQAFDEHGYDWCLENPVGTGPYVMVENVTDSYKKFVKNEHYWNTETPPLYDEVEVRILGNDMAAQAALNNGDIDVFNGSDFGMINNLIAMGFNHFHNKMWYRVHFLMFASANENSPLSDVRVRQAICYAIDSESMVRALDYGRTFVSNQYAVEGTPFYNPDVAGYNYDVAKAKELLKEAGYENGFSTKIVTGVHQRVDRYMIAIQDYLAQIGITVELVYLDQNEFMSKAIYEIDEGMLYGFHGFGSNFINQAVTNFSKRGIGGVGLLNQSKIHPDDLHETLLNALKATDEEEAYKLAQEANHLIIDKYCIAYPVLDTYYFQIITQPDIFDGGFCDGFNRPVNYNLIYRIKTDN